MCKSHPGSDLAPGTVVIQNEFLSPLLPGARAAATTGCKPGGNGSSPRARGCGCPLCVPCIPGPCASTGVRVWGQSLSVSGIERSKSASLPEQGAVAQIPSGLIGKMSDMLKVALGFMQSQ